MLLDPDDVPCRSTSPSGHWPPWGLGCDAIRRATLDASVSQDSRHPMPPTWSSQRPHTGASEGTQPPPVAQKEHDASRHSPQLLKAAQRRNSVEKREMGTVLAGVASTAAVAGAA